MKKYGLIRKMRLTTRVYGIGVTQSHYNVVLRTTNYSYIALAIFMPHIGYWQGSDVELEGQAYAITN